MAGATAGREKRKLTTVEQDLLPIEELVDTGRKSTVGREECLLELVVCCCSQLVQGLVRRVCAGVVAVVDWKLVLGWRGELNQCYPLLRSWSCSCRWLEKKVPFFCCWKIFCHQCCVPEDNIIAAGKGRLLLISAGTIKTPLLLLHGSDHALLLLLRGGVTGDEDDGSGDVMILAWQACQ